MHLEEDGVVRLAPTPSSTRKLAERLLKQQIILIMPLVRISASRWSLELTFSSKAML